MHDLTRRSLTLGSIGLAASLAMRPSLLEAETTATAAASSSDQDPLWYVNPELRELVRKYLPLVKDQPPPSDATLEKSRKLTVAPEALLPGIPLVRRSIAGPKGQPEVPIFIINAKSGARRGGILHTHGGGFIGGIVDTDFAWLQSIAANLDCCIVSVAYRLAPETRFEGSTEDNYSGLLWLHRHADELGVDPTRIAVMGESAGGGHAALLALNARDRGEVPIAFQCLSQPMLDDRTGSSRAVPFPVGTLGWTAAHNRYGWRSFLGRDPGGSDVPMAGVPARHENLTGLPPSWIGVGSIDLFVSEDLEYGRRLIESGIPTELLVIPGAFHGFDRFVPASSIARQFNEARITALRRAFAVS